MENKNDQEENASGKVVTFPTSKFSIAALICGILVIWPLRILAAIPAVICGHLALREIKAAQGSMSGKGYAIFGLIVGYLDIVILVVCAIAAPFLLQNLRDSVQQLQSELQSSQSSN